MPYSKDGKWKAQVRKNGRRKEKTFRTKKDAQAWESMMRQSESEWKEEIDTICLIEWSTKYLDYSYETYAEKTYKEKQAVFKRFLKEVDPYMPVDELSMSITQSYFIKQKKDRSGHASNKDRKNLLAGWNWGKLYMNPKLPKTNPFETPKMPEVRTPRYIPPEEDFRKVFGMAEGQDRLMLLTFSHLACRRGEAFKLTWEDVDFKKELIRLWTQKRENGNREYEWLPMTEELQDGLSWWRKECPVKTDYVFVCLEQTSFCAEYYGGPFKHRQHFMRKLCEKAGVKPFGFHAIRHLSASILYDAGCSVSVIQTILRHKSPNTTARYLKSLGHENTREALKYLSMDRNSKKKGETGLRDDDL